MSKIEVNTVDVASGSTLTLGSSGKTIALASGTTNSINIKDIDWQSVVSADTTMVAGRGYFVDSSGGTKTMTLPASPSIGDTVAVHALDGNTNAVTVARNSSKIEGGTNDLSISTDYGAVTLIFSDADNGWVRHNNEAPDSFISATGGTASTSGSFKIHTFNSSGNFVVSSLSNVSANNNVDYVVVAGGGGGGRGNGGGGGAGGFREAKDSTLASPHTASPLAATTGITVTAQTYPITVGSGGAGRTGSGGRGTSGNNSVFSTITSAGGGGGGSNDTPGNGFNGGSGGGGGNPNFSGGSGNSPPVSPPQGNNGGNATASSPASAGGGGAGGASVSSSITGSSVARAGGGGGGVDAGGTSGSVSGGGGAGATGCSVAGTNGTANTGGGAGGGGGGGGNGGTGGSGVVILRYKYQS